MSAVMKNKRKDRQGKKADQDDNKRIRAQPVSYESFTPTGFKFAEKFPFVTVGVAIVIIVDGFLLVFTNAGYLMHRIPVGEVTLLFGVSRGSEDNAVYVADGMSIVRVNLMTGFKKTIAIDPEYFDPPTAGAASGSGFVIQCGSSDVLFFTEEGMRSDSYYSDITALAANAECVFAMRDGYVHVHSPKDFKEVHQIQKGSIQFVPEHMAVNGDLLLLTNGPDGVWCNFEPGKPCEFHPFTLPFAPTCIWPYSTDRFACGTGSGIEIVDLAMLKKLSNQ